MAELDAVLNPRSANTFRDALLTLTKFSDEVFIEARTDSLILSSLEVTKTAFTSFRFATDPYIAGHARRSPEPADREEEPVEEARFFERYTFGQAPRSGRDGSLEEDPVFCGSFLIKALLWAFKGRPGDGASELAKETAVQLYELSLLETVEGACRFVITMPCRHGATKIYRLIYEDTQPIKPIFNKQDVPNLWEISSKILWDHVDHFVQKGEHLDIRFENGSIHLKCYTEKVVDGKDIIKKPSKTKLKIGSSDFDSLKVSQRDIPIRIPIKDFVAMASHANSFDTKICAYWSQPKRPILFTYSWEGMQCEYTIMTAKPIFDPEEGQPPTAGVPNSKGATPAIALNRALPRRSATAANDLAMKSKDLRARNTVKAQNPRLAAVETDALSVPPPSSGLFLHDLPDEPALARRTNINRLDEDEPLETVSWDASAQFRSTAHLQARDHRPALDEDVMNDTSKGTRKRRRLVESDDEMAGFGEQMDEQVGGSTARQPEPEAADDERDSTGFVSREELLQPTQRLSQIKGMFDDFPDF